jgi:hypothetical protein
MLSALIGTAQTVDESADQRNEMEPNSSIQKADVLLRPWHMGETSDATRSSYDASLHRRRIEITELAAGGKFKPLKYWLR